MGKQEAWGTALFLWAAGCEGRNRGFGAESGNGRGGISAFLFGGKEGIIGITCEGTVL